MKPQLFLLHFAGGNCNSYQFLRPYLKEFEVVPLELPGRGRRIHEPLLKNFDQAAEDFFRQIVSKLSSPHFMIYGHSMGARLGLRVCSLLETIGKFPIHLFVTGNCGPTGADDKRTYLLNYGDFVAELKRLGGVPLEIMENKELFNFFEPILRADFEIIEKDDRYIESPVQCPIYAVMGSGEEKTELISNWSEFTRSRFSFEILEGDHFFIFKHAHRIGRIIKQNYDNITLFQYPANIR